MKRFYNYSIVLVFLFVIGLFSINHFTHILKDAEYNENKNKAKLPYFDFNKLDSYPKKFEAYYTDNFSLRGTFLNLMGIINLKIWKKSPMPDKLIIGEDNWLFVVDKELDCFLGKRNLSDGQMKMVLKEFNYRKQILDSMGIEMLLVINPTKYGIYKEYLPNNLGGSTALSAGEQLEKYFKENSEIKTIFTNRFLLGHKDSDLLYYKGDNHWNYLGAYYAAKGISRVIYKNDVNIDLSQYCYDTITNWTGNLANMAANASAFSESRILVRRCDNEAKEFNRFEHPPIEFGLKREYQRSFKSDNEKLLDALIVRDSYGNALIPYLKNSFYHSTFIFDAWNYKFNLDIIKKEQPDIVIYMVLESLIPNIYKRGLSDEVKN